MSLSASKAHLTRRRHGVSSEVLKDSKATEHIKKVSVSSLRPGMFICDFNAGWMSHPFLLNRLYIRSDAEIAEITKYGINSVFIDTRQGIDVADAPTLDQVVATSRHEMLGSALAQPAPPADDNQLRPPTAEDIRRARQVLNQAASRLQQAMADARLGKAMDIPALRDSVNNISASVIRNSSAMALVCRLRKRDEYTFNHSLNVGVLLTRFSHYLGHDVVRTQEIALGGVLHDIGKMAVQAEVLKKPGQLTEDEYNHMKTHVDRGLALVAPYALADATLNVITEHHERYDGNGYPGGLRGAAISEFGRMAAIVDVYDAISSDRVYHKGLPAPEAMRRIFEWQQHFDTSLVSQFVRCLGIYPIGSLVRLKSDRLAIVVQHHPEDLMRPRVKVIFNARHKTPLAPEEIDLSAKHWLEREAVLGHEDPKQWGIDISLHFDC